MLIFAFVKTNFRKPIIFFALLFLVLIGIQSYYLYNTAQLWKSEIYRDVRNRLDDYFTSSKEDDYSDDIATETLSKYENNEIPQQEFIKNYSRKEKFGEKDISDEIDRLFLKDGYKVGLRKQINSVYSYQKNKEILKLPITVYKTKNDFAEGKTVTTGEWDTYSKSKDTENPNKSYNYRFLVKDVTKFDILNINSILFRKLAPQLLLNILIAALILYIFYRTLKNLREKENKILQLHTTIDSIAHELNTPVTTLKFALPNVENLEIKNVISRQIKRLENISSTIHSQNLESELLTEELLDAYLKELQERFGSEKLIIENHFRTNQRILFSDFKLMVDNLTENASKYGATEISIKIDIDKNSKIVIEDNGVGIPDAETEKIFEKYYRIPNAKNSEINGLGMGLFLVKQTVDKYSGIITVKSLKYKGVTFKIEIPNGN